MRGSDPPTPPAGVPRVPGAGPDAVLRRPAACVRRRGGPPRRRPAAHWAPRGGRARVRWEGVVPLPARGVATVRHNPPGMRPTKASM